MRRLLALLALAVPCPAFAGEFPARVVGVTDGDTLTVLTAEKTRVKVRLHGIDAPETGQDFGTRAKQVASGLSFGKEVTVRTVDKDRYGRTVAEVVLPDGRSLNREMVREGMAWWYREYAPGDEDLARLEAEARGSRSGLWGQPNPTAPWDWRHPKAGPSGRVVGNRNSRLFHASNCPSVARIKEGNRVGFGAAKDAEAAGYRKAGDCR